MSSTFRFPTLPGDPFRGFTLQVHEALEPVRDAWRQVLQDGAAYVFQTWEWNRAWQATIGRAQGVQPRIIEVRDAQQRPVAIWPLGIYRRCRLRVLDFLGDAVSDYRAPALAADFVATLPPNAFEALWRAIVRSIRDIDLIVLRRMPAQLEADGEPVNPMVRLPGARHTENAHATRLPDCVETFRKGLSSQRLSTMRRKLRRLEEVAPVRITLRHDEGTLPPVMQALAQQKSRRCRETGVRDLFAETGYLDFYRELAFEPGTGADVVVSSIQAGDTVVAAHWGACYRGRLYWILPTYEEGDWTRYSCGRALLNAVIEWGIEHRMEVFDMTVGDESYKKDWADHSLPLYEWRQAVTWQGRGALVAQDVKVWARSKPWVRNVTMRLKGVGTAPKLSLAKAGMFARLMAFVAGNKGLSAAGRR
ncbi:GNAT family N-acetyltransferase [Bordetella genomosp. 13]|nr:GNAT family N-acetyltransferase [Bordetella genomosp. 13]